MFCKKTWIYNLHNHNAHYVNEVFHEYYKFHNNIRSMGEVKTIKVFSITMKFASYREIGFF
jgi:hypothetical protein